MEILSTIYEFTNEKIFLLYIIFIYVLFVDYVNKIPWNL